MFGTNRRLMIGLLIGIFGVAFQAFGVLTAMELAMIELRAMRVYAWAFSSFLIGMVMSIVIAGRLTDRHGPSKPLMVGFFLFALGLTGAMLAPNVAVMLSARFLQGLGSGAMNLALFVLVAQLFDETQRSRLMAVLAFLWVMPAFLGPPIAGWIATHLGWRWVFGVTYIPIAICLVLALAPLLKLDLKVPHAQPDPVPIWAGIVLGLGVAALQVAGQRLTWVSLIIGALGVAALVWVVPIIMPKGFFRAAPGLPSVVWVRALQSGTFFAAEPFVPVMFTRLRELSPGQAGLFLTVGSIGWTIGSAIQSQPWFKMRRDQIITLGAVAAAIGLTLVAGFAWSRGIMWYVVPGLGWVLTGFGMGLSQASTSLAVMGLSEPEKQGRNTSSLQVAEGMGSAMLTGLAGSIAAWVHLGHNPSMALGAVFTALAVLCVLNIWLTRRIGPIPNAVAGR